ncbi:uncharacterized protein TNCV_118081 [Trichonephila clavipes]|nr:uncharacterized protein TNCV_118081 [Trichonephila clavipes]
MSESVAANHLNLCDVHPYEKNSCAAEQSQSDASLEAVNQPAPNNSRNWQWMRKGNVNERRLTPASHDESRSNLWGQDGRIHVRRYAGERCLPKCVIERHSDLTPGVMVWRVISHHGQSKLIRIEGNLNRNRYVREVLLSEVVPFL